ELLDWQKEFNKQINKIRYVIEQVIANFKTWRIMHTDYRRPPSNIPRNHLSRSRPALLRNRLNNPQYLWREQFQIADYEREEVGRAHSISERRLPIPVRHC